MTCPALGDTIGVGTPLWAGVGEHPVRTGNVATEDVAHMLDGMGIAHGVACRERARPGVDLK